MTHPLLNALTGTSHHTSRKTVVWIVPPGMASLHEAFITSAAVECAEEGPVGYIETWFLRGAAPYVTEHSRTLRLDQFVQFWQAQAIELWTGQINRALPVFFYWVSPVPRSPDQRERLGHLILHQMPLPHLVPVIVTIDFERPQGHTLNFAAALLDNPVDCSSVRDLLHLTRLCVNRRCYLRLHGKLLASR